MNATERIAFTDNIIRDVNAHGGMTGPTYNFSGGGYSWDEWFEQRGLNIRLLDGYIGNEVPFEHEINDPEFAWILAIEYNFLQKTYGPQMLIWNNTWSQETTLPWRLSPSANSVIQITTDNAKLSANSAWDFPLEFLQATDWDRDNLPYRLGFVTTEVLEKMFLAAAGEWELWMSEGLLNWRNFPYELFELSEV